MKFKKTKLTALAMSVLMAASTITSVTWAADLFTDGAPAEVAVETPAFVSDGETEEIVENEALLSDNPGSVAQSIEDVKFTYKKGEVVVNYTVVYDNGSLPGKKDVHADPIEDTKQIQNCEHPARAIYTFYCEELKQTISSVNADLSAVGGTTNDETGYIVTEGSTKDPHTFNAKTEYIAKPASCYEDGESWVYPGCSVCKQHAKNLNPGENDYESRPTSSTQYNDIVVKPNTERAPHTYDETKRVIITDDAYDALYAASFGETSSSLAAEFHNCKVSSDKKTAEAIDLAKDAYCYTVNKCIICGNPDIKKEPVHYADGKVDTGTYCEFETGDNIYGFVIFNGTELQVAMDGGSPSKKVLQEKVIDIVLENCKRDGTYYIRQYEKIDGKVQVEPVHEEEKTVSAGDHALMNVQIETVDENPKTVTEEDYLLKKNNATSYPDRKDWYVVDKDAQGNVIAAYSNDCTREAKYALCRKCFSPNCTYSETYGDVKTAPKSTTEHKFGVWSETFDPKDDTYTQVNSTYHIVQHYLNRTCERCGKKELKESTSEKQEHKLVYKKIEGSDVEPTCGKEGSYQSALTCDCKYQIAESTTTTKVNPTDKHDFGTNAAEIVWTGEIYVNDGKNPSSRNVKAYVARKCNVCGELDGNAINTESTGTVRMLPVTIKDVNEKKDVIPAKKDPTTGVTYPCSTAHVTLYVEWVGTVDGKIVKLSSTKTDVPYYADIETYQGATAHQAGDVEIEHEVAATTEKEGSYDKVIYCKVCGDEMSRETVTVPKLDPEVKIDVPTVTATAVNYNTVNVSWTPVEGATSYRLYYRSADLGITTWHRVRTLKGTSFTHSGLTTGARYRYTVRAEVNGKLGDYSKTGSVARPLPAAPEMKSVTAVSNGTKVTWSKVDGADGYIIFRKTTGAFTRVGAVSKGSKVTWTDRKPVSGATYKVRAYRSVNNVNYKGAFSAAK